MPLRFARCSKFSQTDVKISQVRETRFQDLEPRDRDRNKESESDRRYNGERRRQRATEGQRNSQVEKHARFMFYCFYFVRVGITKHRNAENRIHT
jgi:hypothetical protein